MVPKAHSAVVEETSHPWTRLEAEDWMQEMTVVEVAAARCRYAMEVMVVVAVVRADHVVFSMHFLSRLIE
jgi:hypothetical protein